MVADIFERMSKMKLLSAF